MYILLFHLLFQKLPGKAIFNLTQPFGRSGKKNIATARSAFGAEIYHMVNYFYNVKVMLNYQYGIAFIY